MIFEIINLWLSILSMIPMLASLFIVYKRDNIKYLIKNGLVCYSCYSDIEKYDKSSYINSKTGMIYTQINKGVTQCQSCKRDNKLNLLLNKSIPFRRYIQMPITSYLSLCLIIMSIFVSIFCLMFKFPSFSGILLFSGQLLSLFHYYYNSRKKINI